MERHTGIPCYMCVLKMLFHLNTSNRISSISIKSASWPIKCSKENRAVSIVKESKGWRGNWDHQPWYLFCTSIACEIRRQEMSENEWIFSHSQKIHNTPILKFHHKCQWSYMQKSILVIFSINSILFSTNTITHFILVFNHLIWLTISPPIRSPIHPLSKPSTGILVSVYFYNFHY